MKASVWFADGTTQHEVVTSHDTMFAAMGEVKRLLAKPVKPGCYIELSVAGGSIRENYRSFGGNSTRKPVWRVANTELKAAVTGWADVN